MPKPQIDLKANASKASASAAIVIPKGVLKELALDQIELDPVTDVRKGVSPKDEPAAIDLLARAMYSNGQLQPILVRPNSKGGNYLLVAGRRRFKSACLIESNTNTKWPIQALVCEMTDEEAWEAALAENIQRRDFSDIEFARNCMDVRERKGFTGADWTKHVAAFLNVSRATILKKTELLTLPEEIQGKVHAGKMSTDAAYVYLATQTPKRGKVLADAEVAAEEEAKAKHARKTSTGKGAANHGKGSKNAANDAVASATPSQSPAAKVQKKHILAAARKNEALDVSKPRTRAEILEYFSELTGPAFPAPMVQFASILVERWATGELKKNTVLTNQWHAVAALVEAGMRKAAASKSVKKTGKKAA